MTDEEKTEEYTNNRDCYVYDCEGNGIDITENLRQAYFDGLTEGGKESCEVCEKESIKEFQKLFDKEREIIEELKKENEQLQQAYTITVDKSVIREQELEAQIEKMECCGNCINHNDLCYCELDRKEVNANNVCNKWEWEKDDTVSIFR